MGEFIHHNKNHFVLYCGGVMGAEGGMTDTCSYSLIARILLLISGVEPHPGPPITYTIRLAQAPYSSRKDPRQLLIMCSNGQVHGNLATILHYSKMINTILLESGSCRYKYYIVYPNCVKNILVFYYENFKLFQRIPKYKNYYPGDKLF